MTGTPLRLAYVVSHPIQYQAPLLRRIAAEPGIDLTVFFCSDPSIKPAVNPGFSRVVQWDVPLLDGYAHEFLPGWGDRRLSGFWQPWPRGLHKRLARGGFHALWVHGYARWSSWLAIAAANRLGLPVLVRDEANAISTRRGPGRIRLKRAFMAGLDRTVAAYLAIGSLNRDYYLAHGVAPDRIFLMPYAVDNERFRRESEDAAPRREELRRSLDLDSDRPVVLTAARLVAEKAPDLLIEAQRRLVATLPERIRPYLVLVGDGPLRAEIEARAAGIEGVRLTGFRNQTELPAFYDLADLFVLPSLKEPWGLVVNEAMNAGRAIIVSDRVGAGPDLVRPGINGAIVPALDVGALAAAIARLTADRTRLAAMGRASLKIVGRWSFEEDVAGLKTALNRVVRR